MKSLLMSNWTGLNNGENSMAEFIKGLKLCEGFFNECAKPVIDKYFPDLQYSAGLIGYGSDVLGYDDAVSRDHMWGPRFYMFLRENDIDKKDEIFNKFAEHLPYKYMGYSVNFTKPDPNDCGVQHSKFISSGKVNPLIFIQTFDEFLIDEIGTSDLENITPLDWLAFSEHRLLSLVSGKMFADKLNIRQKTDKIKFYPDEVKLYLIASQWKIIASEQAFVKRCGEVGDESGSLIICARIAERLMRLCFLYKDTYAPYSKWFGTAFNKLNIDKNIKLKINAALKANNLTERENNLVEAQVFVADLHNASGITDKVDYNIESYFGRDIRVIFADRFVDATIEKLKGTGFENIPLIGTMSQFGGLSDFADEKVYYEQIKRIYGV